MHLTMWDYHEVLRPDLDPESLIRTDVPWPFHLLSTSGPISHAQFSLDQQIFA